MKKGIILFFFTWSTCYGHWSQWPISTDSHRYNWEDCRTNWQQLITAVKERGAATEVPAYSNFEIVAEYAQPAGLSNNTVVWIAEGFPDAHANFAYTVNSTNAAIANNVHGCYLDKSGIFETYLYYSGGSYYGDALLSFGTTNWFTDSAMTSRISSAKTYVTNGFTNSYQSWTNVTMTNLNITLYTVDGVTYTGYPYLSRDAIVQMDARIKLLIPYYARTNLASNGSYNAWFKSGSATNHPQEIPMWNGAALFSYLSIGYVTNTIISTNEWGNLITGGDYYFTRYPLQTGEVWTLFESAYHGYWTTNIITSKDIQYYDAGLPKAVYISTGSVPSIDFTINGLRLLESNQESGVPGLYTTNDSETVSISGVTTDLTKKWYSISNVTCSSAATTGDVLAIQYLNPHKTYGTHPYALYAEDLDERWKVLNALRWTAPAFGFISTNVISKDSYDTTGVTTWASAKARSEGTNVFKTNTWSGHAMRITYGNVYSNAYLDTNTSEYVTYPLYIAQIIWASNAVALKTATNQTTKAYLYFKTGTNDDARETVYDEQYDPYYGKVNQYEAYQYSYTITNNQVLTNWYGGTNTPTKWNWVDAPEWVPTNLIHEHIKGYFIEGVEVLFKWDELTNSFQMID